MLKKTGLSLVQIKRKLAKKKLVETGSRRSGDEQTDEIELLAEKVAAVVKMEVLRFLKREEG